VSYIKAHVLEKIGQLAGFLLLAYAVGKILTSSCANTLFKADLIRKLYTVKNVTKKLP
jgi:hypothetical protein